MRNQVLLSNLKRPDDERPLGFSALQAEVDGISSQVFFHAGLGGLEH